MPPTRATAYEAAPNTHNRHDNSTTSSTTSAMMHTNRSVQLKPKHVHTPNGHDHAELTTLTRRHVHSGRDATTRYCTRAAIDNLMSARHRARAATTTNSRARAHTHTHYRNIACSVVPYNAPSMSRAAFRSTTRRARTFDNPTDRASTQTPTDRRTVDPSEYAHRCNRGHTRRAHRPMSFRKSTPAQPTATRRRRPSTRRRAVLAAPTLPRVVADRTANTSSCASARARTAVGSAHAFTRHFSRRLRSRTRRVPCPRSRSLRRTGRRPSRRSRRRRRTRGAPASAATSPSVAQAA